MNLIILGGKDDFYIVIRERFLRLIQDGLWLIDCRDMKSFDGSGSSNPALYWAPESGCKLATWQTAYSALIEGNYARCKAEL